MNILESLSLEEAKQAIRDSSLSVRDHLVAAVILHHDAITHTTSKCTLEDLLICVRHPYPRIAWLGAIALHRQTGRPERYGPTGELIVNPDDWESYLGNKE